MMFGSEVSEELNELVDYLSNSVVVVVSVLLN